MNIILIEDDEFKARQIIDYVSSLGHEVVLRKAFNTGMKEIISKNYDLALLDMTIPSFEISPEQPTSRTRKYGGRDILSEIDRCEIDLPSIIITQYKVIGDDEIPIEKIDTELKAEYSAIYHGIVYFNSSMLEWQDKLTKLIKNLEGDK